MATLPQTNPGAQPKNIRELLERAGYTIRGNRTDCKFCEGSKRLTVAISDQFAYCHRCHWKTSLREFAQKQGVTLPPETPEHRQARQLTKEFTERIDRQERMLIQQHRILWRRAEIAHIALKFFPDWEEAWDVLANYYNAEAEILAALDSLSLESVSQWLETPMKPEELFKFWRESRAR